MQFRIFDPDLVSRHYGIQVGALYDAEMIGFV